jgi:outer membrane protein assembly factor BamB
MQAGTWIPCGEARMRAIRTLFRFYVLVPTLLLTPLHFVRADDWPQWLGPQRDAIWRETGILDKFPEGGPRVRWRAPIGAGYSGPVVANGRVYVTDRFLAAGVKTPKNGFAKERLPGKERILCLDEKTGELLWKHEYDCTYDVSYSDGPRASPLVSDGRVYTLGAMGNLICLDAEKGKVIWSKDFVADLKAPVPLWGFAANLLLDGDKLICLVGGKEQVVVAFDKNTGAVKWHALSLQNRKSQIGYSSPVIYTFGGKRQLIIWHPDSVNGLDPETGELYWSQPFSAEANLTAPMPRKDGDLLFITSFYNGAMMLKFEGDKPRELWRGKVKSEMPDRTDTLNSIIPTPFLRDGYIYGICSYGELRCLRESDGKRLWMSLKATEVPDESVRWANAFLIAQGDRFFLPNEKGDLIIARLTPQGYEEIDRAHILDPTDPSPGRRVVWSHPAFANKSMYARNDKEIVCVSLAAK